jgi:non-ribosomal peptide synthetase component F
MHADAEVSVLLTEAGLAEQLELGPVRQLDLETDWTLIARQPETNPEPVTVPANLAYVIYTSGSTGRPKGVAITHKSAATLVRWAQEVYDGETLSSVLATTSICFDLSVYELFVPLSMGGTVVLLRDALSLINEEWTQECGARLLNTVPTAMAELVRAGCVPASVRVVNLAGEALGRELVEAIYETSTVDRVVISMGRRRTRPTRRRLS